MSQNTMTSPMRQIKARVCVYTTHTQASPIEGEEERIIPLKESTAGKPITIISSKDLLKDIKIETLGEDSKFFGYGYTQKATIQIALTNYPIETLNAIRDCFKRNNAIKIGFSLDDGKTYYDTNYPFLYIESSQLDGVTKTLTVCAQDSILTLASKIKLQEITLPESYTISQIASSICSSLGYNIEMYSYNTRWKLSYPKGANFNGKESLREVLDDIAEATQTIYYIDGAHISFHKLKASYIGSQYTIDRKLYTDLTTEKPVILTAIGTVTDLGDNVIAKSGMEGVTQYIINNPFLDLRDDIDTILKEALEEVKGLTLTPYHCIWRGNYTLKGGQDIMLEENPDYYRSYYDRFGFSILGSNTIEYNGGMKQECGWKYEEDNREISTNSVGLGEALKDTSAKVDKANNEIRLIASKADANTTAISSLKMNTDSINASVENTQKALQDGLAETSNQISQLSEKVDTKMTSQDLTIEIQKELQNAEINKVTTSTGFTFNEEGLTVNKTNSEMSTKITEDGMKVYRNSEEVLVANNTGVDAVNLHATTYLMIGTNSRFEDYGDNRTGCFYIGQHM